MNFLDKKFKKIKSIFFPRWDKENNWQLSNSINANFSNICPDGHCSNSSKTLYILSDINEYERMLIHLICHAIVGNNHGNLWKKRMLKVADLAKKYELNELASSINNDVYHYIKSLKPTKESVENKCYQTALNLPYSSPEVWLEIVSTSYGITGRELKKKFPKAPINGFKKAKKFFESLNDPQLSFL